MIIAVVDMQALECNEPDLTLLKITRNVVPESPERNISLHEQSHVSTTPETGLYPKLFGTCF